MSADESSGDGDLIRFPYSRVPPTGAGTSVKHLGSSRLAGPLGMPARQATGHWCSRCQGIWFGYPLEVTCPVCGNRHG
jgi:hypothetical protein